MPSNKNINNIIKDSENGSLLEDIEFTPPRRETKQPGPGSQGPYKTYILPGLLVFYSIIKEFKVGEPFLYKYHSEALNYTTETLNGEVSNF